MAAIATPLLVASTVMSAAGSLQAGSAAATAGTEQNLAEQYQAKQLSTEAGQVVAAGERQQGNDLLAGKLALSSAAASAGASGGGGADTDPGVAVLQQQIAGRSEYNALTDLFSAEQQASGLTNQAQADIYQGQQYAQAGQLQQQAFGIGALTSLVGGIGNAYRIGSLPAPSSATAGAPVIPVVSTPLTGAAGPSLLQKYG